jgi:hypothetical protein
LVYRGNVTDPTKDTTTVVKPGRCVCGEELPWHLVSLRLPGFKHICSCNRRYAYMDKRTLRLDGTEFNPFVEPTRH